MIRNIIFDMGNVLLDYEPLLACYRYTRDWVVAEKLNKAIFGTHDWCTLVDGGLMDDEEYAQLMRSKMETPELGALAAAVLSDWWVDSMYLKSGMDALVKELLDAAMPLYILSNVGTTFMSSVTKFLLLSVLAALYSPAKRNCASLILNCSAECASVTASIRRKHSLWMIGPPT